jgi:hypothetical protein
MPCCSARLVFSGDRFLGEDGRKVHRQSINTCPIVSKKIYKYLQPPALSLHPNSTAHLPLLSSRQAPVRLPPPADFLALSPLRLPEHEREKLIYL